MIKVNVYNREGTQIDSLELSDRIFGITPHKTAMHAAVIGYLRNQRQGNAHTKTKAEVSGGGCKPWRQKGTGRARVGSIRSPLWRKGGITFGPRTREYSFNMTRKMRKLAMISALSTKVNELDFIVVDKFEYEAPKTKNAVSLIRKIAESVPSALVVLDKVENNTILSFRNIPKVNVRQVENLNVYEILKHRKLIATRDAVKKIEEVFA